MSVKQLLGKIGLQEKYICRSPDFYFWDATEFRYYNIPPPEDPYIKDMDEVYRMHESRLLHLKTGIRVRLLTSEDYTGDELTYSLFRPYVITQDDNELDVEDLDLEKEIIVAEGKEITFQDIKK